MSELFAQVHLTILASADSATKDKLARLIPGARAAGVPVPKLRELAEAFRRQHSSLSLDEACDLMDEFCTGRLREEILFGAFLLGRFGKKVASVPWSRLEGWSTALDNWETCDQLASNVSGPVVAADLGLVEQLVRLTASTNPWQRRFALASASELNHKGRSYPAETLRVCRPLLADPEPTVRKAVGWALREASDKAEQLVFAFLLEHRGEMPPPVLRDAAEKLSPTHKQQLSFA